MSASVTKLIAARAELEAAASWFTPGRAVTATERERLFAACRAMITVETEHRLFRAWRKENPDACRCQGPEEDPGPKHIKACPFSDPSHDASPF